MYQNKKTSENKFLRFSVGSDGFEPPKATPAELQSAPFGHSGNCPCFKELSFVLRVQI